MRVSGSLEKSDPNSIQSAGLSPQTDIGEIIVDAIGYDKAYLEEEIGFAGVNDATEYRSEYEQRFARSFSEGGWVFDGDVCKALHEELDGYVSAHGGATSGITILDAGSGTGLCSAFFGSCGFQVVGVEVSITGVLIANQLKDRLHLDNCSFLNRSLEDTGLPDHSIDVFYGRHTLHHFIKYPRVADEFRRLAKPGAIGLFMDPFGENVFKNVFQDKAEMAELGDVLLTADGIKAFFQFEKISLTPFHWASLVDKLLIRKVFGWERQQLVRRLAKATHWIDARIPKNNRLALWAAGLVLTRVNFS